MSRFEHQRDWKVPAYRVARRGILGMVVRPIFEAGVDWLSERITFRAAAIILGPLFLGFVMAGAMDNSHRERILAEQRYSEEPSEAYPWRYAIGGYKKVSASRRVWRGERHGFHVDASDWAEHRLWKAIRKMMGWSFLVGLVVAGIALWRKGLRQEAGAVFDEGSSEYEEFMRRPSGFEQDRQDLQNDWLLSGVPEGPTDQNGPPASRPRFGRKQV